MSVSTESEFLEDINQLIDERLKLVPSGNRSSKENALKLACRHLCISDHAKRARPLLSMYYHWMLSDNIARDFINIGVAAEFIHAASLLHDDIIDDADKRRGKSSANKVFSNAVAVLAGDFLLTEAFDLLRPFERTLSEKAILVVREMTKAAILELDIRGKVDVDIEIWRTIAKGKTGALFSWCGYAAGICCNDIEAAHRLWDIGERIGLIFQLADDLKDFDGDNYNKDVCRDIRNFEASMPIILAINQDLAIKNTFKEAFSYDSIDEQQALELRDIVIRSGAMKEGQALITKELSHIFDALAIYRGTKGGDCLERFIAELVSVHVEAKNVLRA